MAPINKKRKIGIIGVGHVGSHVASMILTRGLCEELILIDCDTKKLKGHTIDLMDTAAYQQKSCKIKNGEYKELADVDILVVSVGGKFFDENRLEELDDSMKLIDEIAPKIENSGFQGIAIVITNPCDLVAYYLSRKISATVIGSGTALDSARFRRRIADDLNVDVKSVEGFCIGEHGDSQVPVWSSVRVGGIVPDKTQLDYKRIEKSTIYAGWEIADAKGSTEFGIGMAASELIRCIFFDEKRILPCSTYLNGEYNEQGLYTSVPCIVGAKGVEEILEVELSEEEQESFHQSCKLLTGYIKKKLI